MSKQNGKATSAYLRISGEKQDTARQERRITATGLPISLWFRDELGKNPRDQAHKRKAFQEMLRAVEAGLIGTIVVDRQDRFLALLTPTSGASSSPCSAKMGPPWSMPMARSCQPLTTFRF